MRRVLAVELATVSKPRRPRWRAALTAVLLTLAGPALTGPARAAEPPSYVELWSFADREITESSGLVVTDEHVVTVNDSGDSGRVFTVSLATGETVGVTRWTDDPRDVEALAPAGADHVWVADIGDNLRRRESIEVLRVPVGPGERTVQPERYTLTYPEHAMDAETLLAHPQTGRLLVVTKNVFGGTVYEAPEQLDPDGPNVLTDLGPVVGIATDGAFFPDGRHLIIRTYARALVYSYPAFEVVGAFDVPDQPQGEGIAVGPDSAVYVSSEGLHQPFLRLDLPSEVRRALEAPTSVPTGVPTGALSDAATGDPDGTTAAESTSGATNAEDGQRADTTDVWLGAWPWLAGAVGLLIVLGMLTPRRPRPPYGVSK